MHFANFEFWRLDCCQEPVLLFLTSHLLSLGQYTLFILKMLVFCMGFLVHVLFSLSKKKKKCQNISFTFGTKIISSIFFFCLSFFSKQLLFADK